MSYCRWSSDDFNCDLYVYADVSGGWTIHVAGNRIVGEVPRVDWPFDVECPEARDRFGLQLAAQSSFLETAERRPIQLPHAGETFHEADPLACAAQIQRLLDLGYRAPAEVVAELLEEAEEA